MWTLVHLLDSLDNRDHSGYILWLLRYPIIISVGHPWDKVCCVGIVSFFYGTFWIGRRRTRYAYSIKISSLKSGKYLRSNTSDRSVIRKRQRYCHDRTLKDDFSSSAAHKMQPFLPRHQQLFIVSHVAVHSRCFVCNRYIFVVWINLILN